MPGGKNRIQEHPKANTNGFRERPDQAGRPRGKRDNISIFSDLLQAEGLEVQDPKVFLLNNLFKIATQGNDYVKLRASLELWDRIYGKPKPTAPEDEPAHQPPILVTSDELEILKKIGIDLSNQPIIQTKTKEQKHAMELLGERFKKKPQIIEAENEEHRNKLEKIREM